MFWRKPKRKTDVHTQRTVCFVGEQDGEPERLLKDALVTEFRNASGLKRAYLARVKSRMECMWPFALLHQKIRRSLSASLLVLPGSSGGMSISIFCF